MVIEKLKNLRNRKDTPVRRRKPDRFAEWRRERSLKKIGLRVAKYGGIVMVGGVIFWLLNRSDLVKISQIEVKSVHAAIDGNVSVEGFNAYANDKYLGSNFFQLNPLLVENESSDYSRFIKKVWVEKHFPNRISIEIHERDPFLALMFEDECYLFDTENEIVEEISASHPEGEEIAETEENEEEKTTAKAKAEQNSLKQLQADCLILSEQHKVPFALVESEGLIRVLDDSKLLLFEELYHALGLMEDQGYDVEKVQLGQTETRFLTSGDKTIIMDMFSDVDTQLRRLTLTLAQIGSERLKMKEVDVRYTRPVMRD